MSNPPKCCGTCQHFDPRWRVREKDVGGGLTAMGGVIGFCSFSASDLKGAPYWLYDKVREIEPPVLGTEAGQHCPAWNEAEEPLGDLDKYIQDAERIQ